jgi:hypothetical protein
MEHLRWEMLARARTEALLRDAHLYRIGVEAAGGQRPLAQALIRLGRRLEQWGERLAGEQTRDVAVGGVR